MRKEVINIKSKLGIAVLTLVSAGAITFGAVSASAHFGDNSEFTKTLAQKLGVSEDNVKSAVDSIRTEKKAQMQKNFEERLSQAVKDGKITEDQKSKILAKNKELQTNRQAKKTELEKWSKDNGIDIKYIGPFGHGFRQGFKAGSK